jgi:hypothetical protein
MATMIAPKKILRSPSLKVIRVPSELNFGKKIAADTEK